MNTDGSDPTLIYADGSLGPAGVPVAADPPVWSPDGSEIAFTGSTGTGFDTREIYVINSDGANPHQPSTFRQLTNNTDSDSGPTWAVPPAAPSLTVTSPRSHASLVGTQTPTITGTGDFAGGDVRIDIYSGSTPNGAPVQSLTATPNPVTGDFAATVGTALPAGTYNLATSQTTGAGDNVNAAPVVFTIAQRANGALVFTRGGDLWIRDVTGAVQQIACPNGDAHGSGCVNTDADEDFASVSPDGAKIVFESARGGNGYHLYTADLDGTHLTQLTSGAGDALTPRWSPDGSTVVYSYEATAGGDFALYTVAADGSGAPQQLTFHPAGSSYDDAAPAYSPDGTEIAFQSDRPLANSSAPAGTYEIYVMDLTGTKDADGNYPLPLRTDDDANDLMPAWSPDGSQLAFQNGPAGAEQILRMSTSADGGPVYVVAADAGGDRSPAWSPDGTQIAYAANDGSGSYHLASSGVDGSGPTQLTSDAASDTSPSWQPMNDCTTVWAGGSGTGQWGSASNWSTGTVPTGTDHVCVPYLVTPVTVVHSTGDDTIPSIEIGEGQTVDLTGGTLAAGEITGSGTFRWTGYAGNVQCSCFETDGLGLSGTLTIGPGVTFDLPGNGAHHLNGTRDIDNFGTITVHDNSELGAATQNWTSNYCQDGHCTITNEPGARIVKVDGAGSAVIDQPVDNNGVVTTASGTLNLLGGAVGPSSGVYRAAGDGATPAYVRFTGGTVTLTDDALLDGSGVSIAGGTVQAGGSLHQLHLSDGTTLELTNGALDGPVDLTSPGAATFRWTEVQGNTQCTCFETDGLGTVRHVDHLAEHHVRPARQRGASPQRHPRHRQLRHDHAARQLRAGSGDAELDVQLLPGRALHGRQRDGRGHHEGRRCRHGGDRPAGRRQRGGGVGYRDAEPGRAAPRPRAPGCTARPARGPLPPT